MSYVLSTAKQPSFLPAAAETAKVNSCCLKLFAGGTSAIFEDSCDNYTVHAD
jgi:hypothetical protein